MNYLSHSRPLYFFLVSILISFILSLYLNVGRSLCFFGLVFLFYSLSLFLSLSFYLSFYPCSKRRWTTGLAKQSKCMELCHACAAYFCFNHKHNSFNLLLLKSFMIYPFHSVSLRFFLCLDLFHLLFLSLNLSLGPSIPISGCFSAFLLDW